ncbi:hypothetical protein [Celeribacter sp.]|uniref:hypothetical protein n=1 Tax=Celeribacter sp. TaxID=1890673 RepID=UPI003A949BF7
MSVKSDEEIWDEIWNEVAVSGLLRDLWLIGVLIDLLAWVCRQTGKDIAEVDLIGWPNQLEIWRDEKLADLALKDPRMYQAARIQMSDIFENFACEYNFPVELTPEDWRFFKKLSIQDVPATRGPCGDHLARDVLIFQIFHAAMRDGTWFDGIGRNYRVTKFARQLSEELNQHSSLLDCDASVLSPETIRSVLKKGNGDFGWIKPGELLSGLAWAED